MFILLWRDFILVWYNFLPTEEHNLVWLQREILPPSILSNCYCVCLSLRQPGIPLYHCPICRRGVSSESILLLCKSTCYAHCHFGGFSLFMTSVTLVFNLLPFPRFFLLRLQSSLIYKGTFPVTVMRRFIRLSYLIWNVYMMNIFQKWTKTHSNRSFMIIIA